VSGGKGANLSNYLLDHVLGGPDYVRLIAVYLALYSVSPNSAGGGTEISTSGTGYGRIAISNNNTNFPAAALAVKTNATVIDFGTATGTWGTVNAGAVMSAITGGYILYFGPLTTPKTISTGDGFRVPISGLVLTES
jgi:hypothetical protein